MVRQNSDRPPPGWSPEHDADRADQAQIMWALLKMKWGTMTPAEQAQHPLFPFPPSDEEEEEKALADMEILEGGADLEDLARLCGRERASERKQILLEFDSGLTVGDWTIRVSVQRKLIRCRGKSADHGEL